MTNLKSEMDHLDRIAAGAFPGYLVRKDLVRQYSRQYPVPTYVVEFLLGRYCASTDPQEIQEGLEIVEKQLTGRTVRTGDEELFKSKAREDGSVKLIDIVRAKLDAKNDCYVAELPSLALKDVQISEPSSLRRRTGGLSGSRCCGPSRCPSRMYWTSWPRAGSRSPPRSGRAS